MDNKYTQETAIARYVPERLGLGADLDALMEQAATECDRDGHRWSPETERLCLHCGGRWAAEGD